MNKIINKFLPLGSKRRQFLKRVLIQNRVSPSLLKKKILRATMVDVRQDITPSERVKLETLKDKFIGERCFIIGNGPSLNHCNLSLLKNEYTFGVNGIFYKTDELGFKPTFYMVEDRHVIDDNTDRINSYHPRYKFFPALYKKKISCSNSTFFFTLDLGFYRENEKSYCCPRFSQDFSTVAYAGQTVTYLNMQLAYYLGFKKVYLVGMDFSYNIPDSAIITGSSIESTEDDENHFHPEYFGKGKKWHDPKVDLVGLNYEFAKKVFEENNRYIFNATIGGKLEIFDRVNYNLLFNNVLNE